MNDKIKIIYDGDCPFCNNFITVANLKKNLKNVVFLNARESIEAKEIISNCKLNIDKGMIVSISGKILFGERAATFIVINGSGGIIFLIYKFLLSNEKVSKIIYPVLVFLRKTYFRIIGFKLINE